MTLIQDPALCIRNLGVYSLHVFKILNFVMQLFIVYITRIRCINKYRIYTVYSPVNLCICRRAKCNKRP